MSLKIQRKVESLIFEVKGHKVMLDSDLADLYGVETRVLNQAIKRHGDRFPKDFAFQLSKTEWVNLMSQSVTSRNSHGGRRKPPTVFTEQGVAMLSSVLNSKTAININVEIMRTFVQIRSLASAYKELEAKIDLVDKKSDKKYQVIAEALMQLKAQMEPVLPKNRRKIGIGSRD